MLEFLISPTANVPTLTSQRLLTLASERVSEPRPTAAPPQASPTQPVRSTAAVSPPESLLIKAERPTTTGSHQSDSFSDSFSDSSNDLSPDADGQSPPPALRSSAITPSTSPPRLAQATPPLPPSSLQNPDPNRDRLLPGMPMPSVPAPETKPPLIAPELPTAPLPEKSAPQFLIRQVRVTGSTVFGPDDFTSAIQSVVGKMVTLADLRAVADSITKLYLSKGYITSRAIVSDRQIVDGVVEIRVIEGSIETIEVLGNRRLRAGYITDRVRLGVSTPLRQDRLEAQLRLLRTDPVLANIEATLRPGTRLGKSILSVRVKEAPTVYGGASVDNYSPPAVGSERFGVYGGLRNPSGLGDDFSVAYNRSFSGGVNSFDFNYRVPVNAMNGTLQLRAAPSRYRITDESLSQGFDISGRSALYEASFRQPVIRTLRQELAVSLGFAFQNGNSSIGGTNLFDTNSRVRVLKFGQDYLSRDAQGAWALRSQFNIGLNVFNAMVRDPGTNNADGRFLSWNGSVQRVQRLGVSHLLIAQADLQLSPDALLPSQQFIIGGGQSVRGYRQNARFGDNGWRFSVEDRIALARNAQSVPTVQLAPFFDIGSVWNSRSNPVPTTAQNWLTSVGLGLILQPSDRVTVRLDYAVPFLRVAEKGNNLQDKAFYFSVNYQL